MMGLRRLSISFSNSFDMMIRVLLYKNIAHSAFLYLLCNYELIYMSYKCTALVTEYFTFPISLHVTEYHLWLPRTPT
jgi:hypothetical protein